MKNIIKNTIIIQAISLGFDFGKYALETDLAEINEALLDFFNENSDLLPQIEEECEVSGRSGYQTLHYGDTSSYGDIIDFSQHWHKPAGTKVFHTDLVMEDEKEGIMKNIQLYTVVEKTRYNTSDEDDDIDDPEDPDEDR